MVGPAFHPDDVDNAIGPPEAFDPGNEATPGVYALQHHLVLELAAFLDEARVPFEFRGGTALHTKVPERRRFSIDLDITTPAGKAVHEALQKGVFVHGARSERSGWCWGFELSTSKEQDEPDDRVGDGRNHSHRCCKGGTVAGG